MTLAISDQAQNREMKAKKCGVNFLAGILKT